MRRKKGEEKGRKDWGKSKKGRSKQLRARGIVLSTCMQSSMHELSKGWTTDDIWQRPFTCTVWADVGQVGSCYSLGEQLELKQCPGGLADYWALRHRKGSRLFHYVRQQTRLNRFRLHHPAATPSHQACSPLYLTYIPSDLDITDVRGVQREPCKSNREEKSVQRACCFFGKGM